MALRHKTEAFRSVSLEYILNYNMIMLLKLKIPEYTEMVV